MRYEKLSNLAANSVLAIPVIDSFGNILVNANAMLTACMIKRLEQLGYRGVYIFDDVSDGIFFDESIPVPVRLNAVQALRSNNVDACMCIANSISNDLINSKKSEIVTDVSHLVKFDNYTFNHSVNVSVYSAMLGILLGYTPQEVNALAVAGMLHDIGKTLVPPEILFKEGELTDEEFEIVKQHSKFGYDMLKGKASILSVVSASVLQHHENEDGSGYPLGLTSDKIYKFAKILHVCDVYDALVSKRCYKDAINPADAIDYLIEKKGTLFAPEIVDKFVQCVVLYPVGITVILSIDVPAIVSGDSGDNKRPIVRFMDGSEINLRTTGISVKSIV